jgi:hypothetical protein
MSAGKVALLLIVFAIAFVHPDIGKCTDKKTDILQHCEDYLKHGAPTPSLHGPCCAAALEVPVLDMQCIVYLLTAKEERIQGSKYLAAQTSLPSFLRASY